jgi:hypothetical protein
MRINLFLFALFILAVVQANSQNTPLSQQMAATAMKKWKDSFSCRLQQRWKSSLALSGIGGVTGNGRNL